MENQKPKYRLKKGVAEKVIRGENTSMTDEKDSAKARLRSLNASDTDETTGEGTGDGNIGRTTRGQQE